MNRTSLVFVVSGLLAGQAIVPSPSSAATVRPLTFGEVVAQAAVIVRGQVVSSRSFRNAPARQAAAGQKQSQPPAAAPAAPSTPQSPQSAGVKNTGRMIFTEFDIQVSQYIKGSGNSVIRLTMPGGTVDGVRAWIPDLPTFKQGEDVLLFLRPGFERAGDPAVGVNQGVFRVVASPAGDAVVLDAAERLVTGFEDDRVVTRRNPAASTASSQLVAGDAGLPVPEAPGAGAARSVEAARAIASSAPPMSLAAFLSAVTARLQR
jgi:hypothetical protein